MAQAGHPWVPAPVPPKKPKQTRMVQLGFLAESSRWAAVSPGMAGDGRAVGTWKAPC